MEFNLRAGPTLLPEPRRNNSSGVWLSSNGTAIKRGKVQERAWWSLSSLLIVRFIGPPRVLREIIVPPPIPFAKDPSTAK